MTDHVQAYDTEQARQEARRRDLLKQYTDDGERPFNARHHGAADVEAELDHIERWQLDHPPMSRDPDSGIVKPRAKGLILPSAHDEEWAKEVIPFSADFKPIPMREWGDYIQQNDPDRVSMRPLCGRKRKDQDSKGSCAFEGVVNNGEAASELADKDNPWPDLNPWPGYYEASGGVDRGSSLAACVKVMSERGCPSAKVWPRYGPGRHAWNERLSEEAHADRKRYKVLEVRRAFSWEELGSACLFGFGFFGAYPGHAWFGCDVLSTSRLIWENSWGDGWGDNGFGTLAANRLAIQQHGAYIILGVSRPTPFATAA